MHPSAREFERDMFLADKIKQLVVKHKIQTIIETGTEYGGTANAFAKLVPQVYTMDLEQKFNSGDLLENVEFFLGDSRIKLISAGFVAKWPILFFLDAHSSIESEEGPLLDELDIIAHLSGGVKGRECAVVIHDCLVPGRDDLGYDSYAGQPISLALAKSGLDKIYPGGAKYYYNSEATGAKRGVLFAEPF